MSEDKKKMTAEEAEAKGLPLAKAEIHDETLNIYLTLLQAALDDDDCPKQVKEDCMLVVEDIQKMDGNIITLTTVGAMRCFMTLTEALKKMSGLRIKEVDDEGELTN